MRYVEAQQKENEENLEEGIEYVKRSLGKRTAIEIDEAQGGQ